MTDGREKLILKMRHRCFSLVAKIPAFGAGFGIGSTILDFGSDWMVISCNLAVSFWRTSSSGSVPKILSNILSVMNDIELHFPSSKASSS